MYRKYHVKHISKQCNLDRLKSGSKMDTNNEKEVWESSKGRHMHKHLLRDWFRQVHASPSTCAHMYKHLLRDWFFRFSWFQIQPSTAGTSINGGAVIRKPRSAWLEGAPAMEHGLFCFVVMPPHSFVWMFVYLFVEKKPGKLYSASCVGRQVNPLGVITHEQRHKTRACQRQCYRPRTCQSMVNTLRTIWG